MRAVGREPIGFAGATNETASGAFAATPLGPTPSTIRLFISLQRVKKSGSAVDPLRGERQKFYLRSASDPIGLTKTVTI